MKTLSLVLLLIASMAFVMLGCSDTATPLVSPNDAVALSATSQPSLAKAVVSGQLIAFAREGTQNTTNIYLMKSNGDKVTQLTFGEPWEYYGRPDWCPDGTKMTLTTVLAADGWLAQIYTMNADGFNKKRLATPGSSDASRWSPDGTKILFTMKGVDWYQIWVMDADGSNLKQVTHDAAFAYAATWAPDSRRIAYSSYTDHQIHAINLDGTGDRVLTNDPVLAENPAWSARDEILFVSGQYANAEICLMNADGSQLKRLTNNSYYDFSPRWSANLGQVVFLSERDGNSELYTMNANGTGQTRITNNPSWDGDPAWAVGIVKFDDLK